MKELQVFVATEDTKLLNLSGGLNVIALLPLAKGEKHSLALGDNGKLVRVAGARINGLGIPRFLKEAGYVLASAEDPRARQIANAAYRVAGRHLVEEALVSRAAKIQKEEQWGTAFAVPFSPDEEIRPFVVSEYIGIVSRVLEFGTGITGTVVRTKFDPDNPTLDVNLLRNWVVCGSEDAARQAPRLSEYGGLVEHAAFVLVNAGLASFEDGTELKRGEDCGEYFRGRLVLKLNVADRLVIGISAMDELEVVYLRNGEVLYKDVEGMSDVTLGAVVGDLASVYCRILDRTLAAASPKKRAAKKVA